MMRTTFTGYLSWRALLVLFAVLAASIPAHAQGHGGLLSMQGIDQQAVHSAAARAFGGVTISNGGTAGLMFVNPASMHGVQGIQVSVGGARRFQELEQVQHYAPVRYYPNLSLLLEGLTDQIPDPDPDLIGFTPADSVQRPFDDLRPNWTHSNNASIPLQALLAVPLRVGNVQLTLGAGAVQYANLDHYYQNNNALNPPVLSVRPLPTPRPTDDNPLTVDWYQTIRSRDGYINGYGLSAAGHLQRLNLTLGVSGLLLNGKSDDFESRLERGRLTFLANEFRADSSVGYVTRTGTSSYSGAEFTISGRISSEWVTLGFVARPPTRITRTFDLALDGQAPSPMDGSENEWLAEPVAGEDRIQLPWRGSAGLLLRPRDDLRIGLEYELRPFASATYTSDAGVESSPWESSSLFRVGAEVDLTSWLVVRAGVRGDAEVFVPEGAAIDDEPVTYRVLSGGFGIHYGGVQWNLTYEHANRSYEDVWGTAISGNEERRHVLVTELIYTLPFGR